MLTSGVYHTQPRKMQTAVRRYNRIQLMRKIRVAKFVPAIRLVKHAK